MFEVDVKNLTEEWRGGGGGGDQLRFGVLILEFQVYTAPMEILGGDPWAPFTVFHTYIHFSFCFLLFHWGGGVHHTQPMVMRENKDLAKILKQDKQCIFWLCLLTGE